MHHAPVASLLLALFVGLALASRGGPLPGDERLLRAWSSSNGVFAVVNMVASVQVWTGLILVGGVCLWLFGQRAAGSALIVADLSGEALVFMVKAIVLRPRPSDAALADALATASFPSGHVMRATTSLGVILFLVAWQRPG